MKNIKNIKKDKNINSGLKNIYNINYAKNTICIKYMIF